MKVVIAYDGSDYAKAAVDDLRRSGMPRKAEALVISVGETLLPPVQSSNLDADHFGVSRRVTSTLTQAQAQASHAMEEARALAQEGTERIHARFPDWDVSAEPLVGTPAAVIMQKAEDWQANLIVVGSQGRSGIGRLVLGSVSKQIAMESPGSVLVARKVVERGDAPIRIIIGMDGSPGAEAAVHAVASRDWPNGTVARVIAVDNTVRATGIAVSILPKVAGWVSESNEAQREKAREMMERTSEELRAAGLNVGPEVIAGTPQQILCDEAQRWEADCIFVGSRGFSSALERFRLGSVSTALVTSAPCSVEVVRLADGPTQL